MHTHSLEPTEEVHISDSDPFIFPLWIAQDMVEVVIKPLTESLSYVRHQARHLSLLPVEDHIGKATAMLSCESLIALLQVSLSVTVDTRLQQTFAASVTLRALIICAAAHAHYEPRLR